LRHSRRGARRFCGGCGTTVAGAARRLWLGANRGGDASLCPLGGAQKTTERSRYASLRDDLQGVGQRLAICGLHVHVGVARRRAAHRPSEPSLLFPAPPVGNYQLPSPFWQGENTGLKSYRLAVFDELPRTGTPERFASWGEYRRHVDILVGAGLIEDATKLWWDFAAEQPLSDA